MSVVNITVRSASIVRKPAARNQRRKHSRFGRHQAYDRLARRARRHCCGERLEQWLGVRYCDDQGPRLDTGCHGIAPEALAVPHDSDVAPGPDHIGPAILLHRVLEAGSIKFPIAQQDHLRSGRYPLFDLLE